MKMSGMWCWILGVLAVVLIVGGCLTWKSMRVSTCAVQDLELSAGQQSGAAGTIYQHMTVKNTGGKKCTLTGYPAAFLYGADGYALGSAAAGRANPLPSVVTLAPGKTAHTVLGYPQAGNFNPGVCSDASTTLKLFVPNAVTPLEVPLAVAWCPGFSATTFTLGS